MISPEFKQKVLALIDGDVEVALLCGSSEPTDGGYSRQTVNFTRGKNTEVAVFGPYETNFRSAITGYCLYWDGISVGTGKVDAQTPTEAESSRFPVGSLSLDIS